MVGSCTAAISWIVRTPSFSISSTTRSLCTTCPRIAPRPPAAAKRFTFRSAIRTPEQNPYFAARLTFIGGAQRPGGAEHSEQAASIFAVTVAVASLLSQAIGAYLPDTNH